MLLVIDDDAGRVSYAVKNGEGRKERGKRASKRERERDVNCVERFAAPHHGLVQGNDPTRDGFSPLPPSCGFFLISSSFSLLSFSSLSPLWSQFFLQTPSPFNNKQLEHPYSYGSSQHAAIPSPYSRQ